MSLAPCPPSPNCVCSQEDPADVEHYMAPLSFSGSPEAALDAIAAAITSSPRAMITNRTDGRVDAVFVSLIFRFKDDVSFLVDDAHQTIHFRSASRMGHSDLGANRKRLNMLLSKIKAEL